MKIICLVIIVICSFLESVSAQEANNKFSEKNIATFIYPRKLQMNSPYKATNSSDVPNLMVGEAKFHMPDFVMVFTQPNDGKVSIFIQSGSSNFSQIALPLTQVPLNNKEYSNKFLFSDWDKDNYGDLIAIEMNPAGKSNMILRVFSGQANFQTCIRTFDLPLEKGSNYNFAVSTVRQKTDTELYAIKHTNTNSHKLELHLIRFSESKSMFPLKKKTTFTQFKLDTQIPESSVKWQPALYAYERPLAENMALIDDVLHPKNVMIFDAFGGSQKKFDGTAEELFAKLEEQERQDVQKVNDLCLKAALEGLGMYIMAQSLPLAVGLGQGWPVVMTTYNFVLDTKSCLQGLNVSDKFKKWFHEPKKTEPEKPGGGGPGIKNKDDFGKETVGIVTIRESE
jgi:hypothetical protein